VSRCKSLSGFHLSSYLLRSFTGRSAYQLNQGLLLIHKAPASSNGPVVHDSFFKRPILTGTEIHLDAMSFRLRCFAPHQQLKVMNGVLLSEFKQLIGIFAGEVLANDLNLRPPHVVKPGLGQL